jgi:site-specific DNA-methyltransferase (adenine-specific)
MNVDLHNCDCLEFMRTMPDKSVDAVITDPPYGINTKSSYNGKQGKLNPWADLTNSAYWYAAWMRECLRIVKDDGCMWTFLNWRSLVTYQKASFDIESPIESLLVWDKQWIGPGGQRGLRPSYEMVALFTNQEFSIDDRGIPDIRRCMWASIKPHGHPAEKPTDLIMWLIEISTNKESIIFDPFMGSGTTGEACSKLGHSFIGCESDPKWYELAERRIAEAQLQMRLPI